MPASGARLEASLWLLLSGFAGLVAGGMVVGQPKLLALPLAALLLLAAERRPAAAVGTCLGACAVYFGVYLRYRSGAGGAPLSALDLMTVAIVIAGAGMAGRRSSALRPSSVGGASFIVLAAGLATGTVAGLVNGAASYQLVRVCRIEVALLAVLWAALVAGHRREWQRAVYVGLYSAAGLAAVEQIISFAYQVTFGHPLWSQFSFGSTTVASLRDVANSTSEIAGSRDNYLPTFIMLPALSLAVYRLRAIDTVMLALIVSASAFSLSRAMWIATILTLLLAIFARIYAGRRLPGRTALGIIAVSVALVVVVGQFSGGVFSTRLGQSLTSNDVSATGRASESRLAFTALESSPVNLVAGLGAGAFAPALHPDPTPVLEDELLARWTNFGILSVLGTIMLLAGCGWRALDGLRRRPDVDADVLAMALCLPAILLIGPFSGTLLFIQVTLPFWVLAGTALAALHGAGDATAAGRLTRRAGPPSGGQAERAIAVL